MAAPANFATLPTEILLLVVSNLSGTGDLNAICQLTRRLYHLFLPDLFERHIDCAKASISTHPKRPLESLISIFLYAVKFNSSELIQQLFCYGDIVDFRGHIPGTPFSHHSITFLHFAVTMDAPVVASQLMKHGSSADLDLDSLSTSYPDLEPLYLALARPNLLSQRELNSGLRIACLYAFPKTTSFLLARGSDARTVSPYGNSALHLTLTRRARWQFFDEFHGYMEPTTFPEIIWEDSILSTAKNLINYGADPRLKTGSTRAHSCDTRCWKSIDCGHSAQSPIHLAASSGLVHLVSFLVKTAGHGLLSEKNSEGYTPLYAACVQGHEETALYILREQAHLSNPMVRQVDESTALHIACRFALKKVLTYLLEHGAAVDTNRADAKGRTPLHEVLSFDNFDREEEVVDTLYLLAKFDANPDHGFASTAELGGRGQTVDEIQTPRQMAGKHAFQSVRDMFLFEEQNIFWGPCKEDNEPQPESEVGEVVAKKGKRKTKKQRERAAAKEHEKSFPALTASGAQAGKTSSLVSMTTSNLPHSLYSGKWESRKMTAWSGKQFAPAKTSTMVQIYEVLPVMMVAGECTADSEIPVKGKGRGGGGKNKWQKLSF